MIGIISSSLVIIKTAVKKPGKINEAEELNSYATVTPEVETTNEETPVETTEETEETVSTEE